MNLEQTIEALDRAIADRSRQWSHQVMPDLTILHSLRDALPSLISDAETLRAMKARGAVGYGYPNTAISGSGPVMMMLRHQIPADDQYGGAFWEPLYALPDTKENGR